jgi:hypothetical protein
MVPERVLFASAILSILERYHPECSDHVGLQLDVRNQILRRYLIDVLSDAMVIEGFFDFMDMRRSIEAITATTPCPPKAGRGYVPQGCRSHREGLDRTQSLLTASSS